MTCFPDFVVHALPRELKSVAGRTKVGIEEHKTELKHSNGMS